MEHFRKLGISEPIVKAIEESRFVKPSMIQEKTIPFVMEGKDVIAGSATGSGKTLAFGAGIIQNSERGRGIQALVLTPTRELAEQVAKTIKKFSKYKPLDITAIYGGVSINPQISELRSSDVVVGTPGRILDHLERRTINLGKVKILVIDEADRMFDMGFIDDVEKIIRRCPEQRQTLLFSATITPEVSRLSKRYMKNPVEISAEQQVDPKKLTQVYYNVQDNLKFSLLVHLLEHEKAGLVMVFCNTRRTVDFVARNLKSARIEAMAIHGGLPQGKRNTVMSQFHSGKVYVLICTDVAARGLDIPGVSHIYNYDIPRESKQYIHRIGRTARAGKEGIAINLLSPRDFDNFDRVLRENRVEVKKEITPNIEQVQVKWNETSKFSRGKFGRGDERRGDRRESRGSRFRRN